MIRVLSVAGGFFLIAVGLVGIIVPVMPGWSLIFLGLLMIAPRLAWTLQNRLERRIFKKPVVFFSEWRKEGILAGITTRHFPLFLKKSDELLIPENQKIFLQNFSEPSERFVFLNQVHGDRLAVLEENLISPDDLFTRIPEADGVITRIPGITLLAFTADCLSLFFYTEPQKGNQDQKWTGIVHAGWRGASKNIAAKACRLLCQKSGCRPSEIHAIFGPCIGVKNYEVGEEFKNYFSGPSLKKYRGKTHFDLFYENKRQLLGEGLLEKNIGWHSMCTVRENRNFYSFRKEKESAGRMISFIRLNSKKS